MLRAVRLRALKEAPDAFGSTLEREIARSDADWSNWIEPNPTFLLEAPTLDTIGAVGMVAGAIDALDPTAAVLLAMWVDPAFRRTGGADLLVQAVVDWARGNHATKVTLCVIAGNDAAIRLYERCGFARTGQQRRYANATSVPSSRCSATSDDLRLGHGRDRCSVVEQGRERFGHLGRAANARDLGTDRVGQFLRLVRVTFWRNDEQLVERRGRGQHVSLHGGAAVAEHHGDAAAGLSRPSCNRATCNAPARSVVPKPRSDSTSLTTRSLGLCTPCDLATTTSLPNASTL